METMNPNSDGDHQRDDEIPQFLDVMRNKKQYAANPPRFVRHNDRVWDTANITHQKILKIEAQKASEIQKYGRKLARNERRALRRIK